MKRVVYWGTYLEHHDLPLIKSVVVAMPEVEFVFCGNAPEKFLLSIGHRPNVSYRGFLP